MGGFVSGMIKWIQRDMEGNSIGLFQGTIPGFGWRDWGEPLRNLWLEIRTRHVRNTDQKRYRLSLVLPSTQSLSLKSVLTRSFLLLLCLPCERCCILTKPPGISTITARSFSLCVSPDSNWSHISSFFGSQCFQEHFVFKHFLQYEGSCVMPLQGERFLWP